MCIKFYRKVSYEDICFLKDVGFWRLKEIYVFFRGVSQFGIIELLVFNIMFNKIGMLQIKINLYIIYWFYLN